MVVPGIIVATLAVRSFVILPDATWCKVFRVTSSRGETTDGRGTLLLVRREHA